jgi:Flp pilus assembly protein protease CpaA
LGAILVLGIDSVPIALVLLAASIAAVTDVWKFKVYNLLTLPFLVSGLLYHAIHGGAPELGGSVVGAVVGFSLMIVLYTMGGMGAGDVKFVTALGAWLGLPLTLYVLIAGCIAAGIYAVVLLVTATSLRETLMNMQILWLRLACLGRHLGHDDRVESEVKRPDRRRRLIPFSAMIALGLVATVGWLRAQSPDLFAASPQRSSSQPSVAAVVAVEQSLPVPLTRGDP